MLASLCLQRREPRDAEGFLRLALESGHPEWRPAALVLRGDIHAFRGQVDQAKQSYRAAIATNHGQYAPEAWYMLGALCRQVGEGEAANEAFRRAMQSGHPEFAPQAAAELARAVSAAAGSGQQSVVIMPFTPGPGAAPAPGRPPPAQGGRPVTSDAATERGATKGPWWLRWLPGRRG